MRRRLDVLAELDALRKTMLGAETPAEPVDDDWQRALGAAEDDLAVLWDAAFCTKVERVLDAQPNAPLAHVLGALEAELDWLHVVEQRLSALSGAVSQVKTKAIGPRLADLVASLMGRLEIRDRTALHNEIEAVLAQLKQANLQRAIPAADWMRWAAEALIRSERHAPPEPKGPFDYDAYVALREQEMRVPIALAVCEVALRVAPELYTTDDQEPSFGELVLQLPEDVQTEIARIDLARIERAVGYLERWWQQLTASEMSVLERLESVVKSRFFDVLWDDEALARFALEAQLVGDVLVAHASDSQALGLRLEALREQTRRAASALLRERTDEAWQAAMAHPRHAL
jgi:hypothetical protein